MYQVSKQKLKIGIPRALSYYNNFPFYYGFFDALGFEVVVSDKTTTKLINEGAKYVVSDTCLPIKVYVGHLLNLLDKGCNTIFVPSLQSSGYKINNCSKIRGLPEIIRNIIDKPFNLIEPTLDKTEGLNLEHFCFEAANQLNIKNEEEIRNAIKEAWKIYNSFLRLAKKGFSFSKAVEFAINGLNPHIYDEESKPISVVIMAHGYNLYDERISMRLIDKLSKMGVRAYTSLNITRDDAIKSIHKLDEIQYWANELDLTGTAAYYMLNNKVDGIIALSAFGCGPDSLMVDEIQYHAKERKMPMLHLTIDEHTGEAGFITRLEAFVDMLIRKKRMNIIQTTEINDNIQNNSENINLNKKVLVKV